MWNKVQVILCSNPFQQNHNQKVELYIIIISLLKKVIII